MAGLANEIDVVEQFKDPDADFHTNMYARMNNMDPDEVTSTQRNVGKTLNFGLTYGMGPYSLALTLFADTSDEKVQEATALGDRYWDSVPNIRDMLREAKDRAYLTGFIETKFGRRRYFPDIRSPENYIRTSNMRRAANTKVQGTGADILKIAHLKVARALKELKLDAMIKISMHDELVVQVHKDLNPWYIINILRDCMELKIKGFPPLFIGANVGDSWAAGKRDDLEIPIRLTEKMVEDGEHLKGGYEDPGRVVEDQIKEFMLNKLRGILESRNLYTVEKALDQAKVAKMVKDYFGGHDSKKLIQDLLDNKPIELDEGFVIYNDVALEFNEDGDDSGYVDLDSGNANMGALNKLAGNKEMLELISPEIKTAKESYKTDYRVMIHDKKCFIKIDDCKKAVLTDLMEYLKEVDNGTGDQVVIVNGSTMHTTPFKIYRVDKIKLLMILDRNTMEIAN